MEKKNRCISQKECGNGYQLAGRIWVEGRQGAFLGYGRVVLLEQIRRHGSISEAARAMEMSYRHAWELVESMNGQSKRPLVETVTGGRSGGGARLTAEGERALEAFTEFHDSFELFLKQQAKKLTF